MKKNNVLITTLLVATMALTSSVFAQPGPGPEGADGRGQGLRGQRMQEMQKRMAKSFNKENLVSLKGTVVEVKEFNPQDMQRPGKEQGQPGRNMKGRTQDKDNNQPGMMNGRMGQRPGMMGPMDTMHMVLKTAKGDARVALGPDKYLDKIGLDLKKGDKIQVTAAKIEARRSGMEIFIAKDVKANGKVYKLRDDEGKPLWRNAMNPNAGKGMGNKQGLKGQRGNPPTPPPTPEND